MLRNQETTLTGQKIQMVWIRKSRTQVQKSVYKHGQKYLNLNLTIRGVLQVPMIRDTGRDTICTKNAIKPVNPKQFEKNPIYTLFQYLGHYPSP